MSPSPKTKKILLLSLSSLILLAGGAYVALHHKPDHTSQSAEPALSQASAEPEAPPALRVETVKPKALKDALSLKLEGHVIAQRKQTISAQVEGRITRVQATVGDTVSAGQTLAQMDNPDRQIDLNALAQQQSLNTSILANLKQKTKDYQDMLNIGLVARHDVQTVENDYRAKQVEQQGLAQQINHLKLGLSRMTVVTPQSGYVTDILSEGSYVTPGQTVATLISSADQYIEVFVPIEQLSSIQPGAQATLTVGSTTKNARVIKITPESQAGLVKVLLQADTILPLEFRPQLSIKLKPVSGWLLPKRALVLAEGVPVFYQVREHKVYPIKAKMIRDLDGQVLVANKLLPTDKIVSSQAEMLHEGMDVNDE